MNGSGAVAKAGTVVDVELALHHDGDAWVVQGEALAAPLRGETLDALDQAVRDHLRGARGIAAGTQARVFMRFDFDTIPVFLRQYHTHYCNRRIVMTL